MRAAVFLALVLAGFGLWPAYAAQLMLTGVGGSAETWSTGLVACWSLDEASGTRADSVGGNTLTDNNTVTQAAGKVSNAAQFVSANGEYLSRADNAALSIGNIDFTLAAWVYLDSKSGYSVVFNRAQGPDKFEYEVGYAPVADPDAPDRFYFAVSADGTTWQSGNIAATSLGSPSTATWYFVVAWHDAAANTINIQVNNGTADNEAYATGLVDTAAEFRIGQSGSMDGRIDAAMFWKRVLSSAERSQAYNGGSGRACP